MGDLGGLLEVLTTDTMVYVWSFVAVAAAAWIIYQSYRESLPSTWNAAFATVLAVFALPALALILFPDVFEGILPEDSTYTRSFLIYLNPLAGMLSIVALLIHWRKHGATNRSIGAAPKTSDLRRTEVAPTPAQRYCDQCGQPQKESWDRCPYCQEAESPQAPSGPPPPVPQPGAGMPDRSGPPPSPMQVSAGGIDRPLPSAQMAPPLPAPNVTRPLTRPADGGTIMLYGQPAWVVFTNGTRQGDVIRLAEPDNVFGRDVEEGIRIADPAVSGLHARIAREAHDGPWVIHDLGASNYVFVNGHKVARQELADGDRILLGKTELGFMELPETST